MFYLNVLIDIDLLAGVTRKEGSLLAHLINPDNFTVDSFKQSVINTNAVFHGLDVQKVMDYYLKGVNTSDSQALKWAYYEFYGDLQLKCPTYILVR